MNSRSSSVSSSSSSSSTPTTTTTHGSIALERLEHEQFLHGSMRLPGEASKQTSSSSARLKKPLRNRHSLQTTDNKAQKFANGERNSSSSQEHLFVFVLSFFHLLAIATKAKDIVFKFVIRVYSSLRVFGPLCNKK
jgi:hypothetical protein